MSERNGSGRPRRIAVVGAGVVGLTTATGLAYLGHDVTVVEVDEIRVGRLASGAVDIAEPELEQLVREYLSRRRLRFTVSIDAARDAEFAFVCVGTPMAPDGTADLAAVHHVYEQLGTVLRSGAIVVDKSTVPVGTARWAGDLLEPAGISVVSNPEFLREGRAVADFLRPERIVVGARTRADADRVVALFADLRAPVRITDQSSAELIKYASNSFLAVKLSFVDELAALCDAVGADIADVAAGMGADPRIGSAFLQPGPGWGGSCLPKDTAALVETARRCNVRLDVVDAAIRANDHQVTRIVETLCTRLGRLDGRRICLWGLAFKAGTGDLRSSPALAVGKRLADAGAVVRGFDPAVPPTTVIASGVGRWLQSACDSYAAAADADAIVVVTEWPQFAEADWTRLAVAVRAPLVLDYRNIIDAERAAAAGFDVIRHGRPALCARVAATSS